MPHAKALRIGPSKDVQVANIDIGPLPGHLLPAGVRSRIVEDVNGLAMHVLEAGERGAAGSLLLLHGFPELAFCWRRLMPLLAAQGYHVVAPDQRGYGRTSAAPVSFEDPVEPYAALNLASDMVALVGRLGLAHVDAVVGHDFGSIVAGACALSRPDLFRRLALLGTPFPGAPMLGAVLGSAPFDDPIHVQLAALPEPRRHYWRYYVGPLANQEMWRCPQGVRAFLRGYYFQKSADWPGNHPHPLERWSAGELARMPPYYCMPADRTMAEVAWADMPTQEQAESCAWLSETDLDVVAGEFARTGFQGGLQWYRSAMNGAMARGLSLFAGRKVEVPVFFATGAADWATFQTPGALEMMRTGLARMPVAVHFVPGAGHWLQQEQPGALRDLLTPFLRRGL